MKNINIFSAEDIDIISDIFEKGLVSYSYETSVSGNLISLSLILVGGESILIQSKVEIIEDWHEIGAITFTRKKLDLEEISRSLKLSKKWNFLNRIEKLINNEDEFYNESGVSIFNQDEEEFIIVPGAFPYSVEMWASFFSREFEPEYDLLDYRRVSLTGG